MFRCLVAAAMFAAGPASMAAAQVSLITVNLSDVNVEIAKNLNLDLDKVPINVLLPVSVAANVCGVDISALGGASLGGDKPSCDASNVTMATQLISNLIGKGEAAPAEQPLETGGSAGTDTTPAEPTDAGATGESDPASGDTATAHPTAGEETGQGTPTDAPEQDGTATEPAEPTREPQPADASTEPAADPASDGTQTDAASQ